MNLSPSSNPVPPADGPRWPDVRCREQCEIQGLVALRDYTVAARAGMMVDSVGPLLALSLVDAAGGMSGPDVFGAVSDMARALRDGACQGSVADFLRGAARGFGRSRDGQSLADVVELANVSTFDRGFTATGTVN
jgi:hypothetical protein